MTFTKIPAFPWQMKLVKPDGTASMEFGRWWQQLFGNTEDLEEGKQDADADLTAISALTTTGYAIRTGDGLWTTRAITVTTGHLTVSDGDGVAGATLLGLPNSGVTAGSYTSANITVDAQGRVTVAANGASGVFVTDGDKGDITVSGTGTVWNIDADTVGPSELVATAVTPGTYGDATHVAQFTVDQEGRLTNAGNVAISGVGGGGSAMIPLVDGSEPPVFITDGAGVLILVGI